MKLPKLLLAALSLAASLAGQTHAAENIIRINAPITKAVGVWLATTPTYSAWTDSGGLYACGAWDPDAQTVGKNISFTQTALCSLDQTAMEQAQKKNTVTGVIIANGEPFQTTRTLSDQPEYQQALGTLEGWSATDPTYTDWVNTRSLYNCGVWSPASSTITTSQVFNQTAACQTDQSRERQDRDIEQYTQEVRNDGSAVTENQTLTGQTSTRAYTVAISDWVNSGSVTDCTNWTPDPSTQGSGTTFTQTATDCKQSQARTRAESYVDPQSGSIVQVSSVQQSQVLSAQSSTRTATGTLENWVATTSVYTTWANTNALYSCGTWSPAGSSVSTSSTFTQTASCSTDQSRTRQDRQIETNTQAVRNVGSPVTETQTLTGQTASRAYTVAISAWANSGAVYGCSNWSPAASTVAAGTAFTQTATNCSINQVRTRTESYVDHKSGSTVVVSSVQQSQVASGQASTQAATGTLVTNVCYAAGNSSYMWDMERIPGQTTWIIGIKWAGATVYQTSASSDLSNVTVVTWNGYTYTKNPANNVSGVTGVCRK